MIDLETIKRIQQLPIEERLQVIELILDSLKQDVYTNENIVSHKPFVVRQFDLGQEIQVDRDELYAEVIVCYICYCPLTLQKRISRRFSLIS